MTVLFSPSIFDCQILLIKIRQIFGYHAFLWQHLRSLKQKAFASSHEIETADFEYLHLKSKH